MNATAIPAEQIHSQRGELTWEVAQFFPAQGHWTEDAYLALENVGGSRVELNDGMLESLPMTSRAHQFLMLYLARIIENHLEKSHTVGDVLAAPFKIRLAPGVIREPDVIYLGSDRAQDQSNPPNGADCLIEIVSTGSEARKRDFDTKRTEYAQAGVSEYWIVDPFHQVVHVLTLDGDVYQEHGVFKSGQTITSVLFSGLTIDIDELFAGKRKEP